MMRLSSIPLWLAVTLGVACSPDPDPAASGDGDGSATAGTGSDSVSMADAAADETTAADGTGSEGEDETEGTVPPEPSYRVGAGIYDITGPPRDVGMMGYADTGQTTTGIHLRLRSRAFIVAADDDDDDDNNNSRVVFVSVDLGQVFIAVKQGVVARLAADPELSAHYGDANVLLSATHTHAGPGGYSHYFLYNFTVGGLVEQNYEVIVDGIVESIRRAHQNLQPGRIQLSTGRVDDVGWQRSAPAYEQNPAQERESYADGDTDKTATVLRLVAADDDQQDLGMIAWHAVHPTAMSPFNTLISGDIHGLASYRFEREQGTDYDAATTFVAAFAQSNSGDVSPNVLWGPPDGVVDPEQLEQLGIRLSDRVRQLWDAPQQELSGPVAHAHHYVDMADVLVESSGRRTCGAAMGASFSAGSSEDNASPLPLYEEGTTRDDLGGVGELGGAILQVIFAGVTGIIWPDALDPEYVDCHGDKPILIPVGAARFEGQPMVPNILPLQLLRIGSLVIVGHPSEISTMAGRRLRESIADRLEPIGVEHVVIAGLSNAYSSYVTTPEEYSAQHYEGASTLFGPDTLPAYVQEFGRLADALVDGRVLPPSVVPPDLSGTGFRTSADVLLDTTPIGADFGDVAAEPQPIYTVGDTVEVVFHGGYPNHDLQTQSSYLTVEHHSGQDEGGTVVADDGDWSTTIQWERTLTETRVRIRWQIDESVAPGIYRIHHRGYARNLLGDLTPYEGASMEFEVQ
ncbi:MAG: neutral/alkaline ceramidase [Myxococcota bacterium]